MCVEISLHAPTEDQSAVAQQAETSVPCWDAFELVFLVACHTKPEQHCPPTPTCLSQAKAVCMLKCNLPPALCAEWQGSFMYYCSNMREGWILRWKSAQKVNSGEQNFPDAPATARDWICDLLMKSPVLYHWAVPPLTGCDGNRKSGWLTECAVHVVVKVGSGEAVVVCDMPELPRIALNRMIKELIPRISCQRHKGAHSRCCTELIHLFQTHQGLFHMDMHFTH